MTGNYVDLKDPLIRLIQLSAKLGMDICVAHDKQLRGIQEGTELGG